MEQIVEQPRTARSQPVIAVTSPLTGEPVGEVPRASAADVITAVERARAAQPKWAALPFDERAEVILRFHNLIIQQREELFDVLQSETGKSRRDAFVELFAVAAEARYYGYHGKEFLAAHRTKSAIPLRDVTRVRYEPVGVVGVISPWNFPFILTTGDTIPALLAGNAVVLKPASLTPLTALWMAEKMVEAGLPESLLQIVAGPGRELGSAIIDNVDYIMFTGSTAVGKSVAEQAARRLIPTSMELGGKNAMVVLSDANIPHAAQVALEAAFNNAGQVCIDIERLYVMQDIYDSFVSELVRQAAELRLGSDRTYNNDIGSLISTEQFELVEEHVQDAVEKGARVLAGGRARPDLGPLFYEPTILEGVREGMTVYREETFGPVLSVYPVTTPEEAVEQVNDSRYGLYHVVASGNRQRGEEIASQLQAGTVTINDSYMGWAAMDAPMGGFKESGIGRRHGPEGIRKYTNSQTILYNRTNWQIGSGETALAFNERLADVLAALLKLWRYIPFFR